MSTVARQRDSLAPRMIAFVASYASGPDTPDGGIASFEVNADGRLRPLHRVDSPGQAGFLAYAPAHHTLYAVDERKSDGRGPVLAPPAVHTFDIAPTGEMTPHRPVASPGANPCYLSLDTSQRTLFCANHGGFEHVEQVRRAADGTWAVSFAYDDSTVLAFALDPFGSIDKLRDVVVLTGHGPDPNTSPQAGGHAQASPHAHCAVVDPSGHWLAVCDKGTDTLLVLDCYESLAVSTATQFPPQTGPRHLVFDPSSDLAFLTCEFSSQITSLRFDASSGEFTVLDTQLSTSNTFSGPNEPADVQLHPNGRVVYVNNRGEDSLVWFAVDDDGRLTPGGSVPLAPSVHPGLAARTFTIDPSGRLLFVADRPADAVRLYSIEPGDGSLTHVRDTDIAAPSHLVLAELSPREPGGAA